MIKSSDSTSGFLPTTGIGSLPELSPGEALEWALATDIPYFPSFPSRQAGEGMLFQGLRDFPGVSGLDSGVLQFDFNTWEQEREGLTERQEEACNRNRYVDFLPTAFPDLWEEFCSRLPNSPKPFAKVQLVGPLSAALALGVEAARPRALVEGLFDQLTGLLFAKAMALATGIRHWEKEPILFLDEPAWGTLDPSRPVRLQAKERLHGLIGDLQNSGLRVGVHCCSRGDFTALLALSPDIISLDVALALEDLTEDREALKTWCSGGGRIAWGVVPTLIPKGWEAEAELDRFLDMLIRSLADKAWVGRLLRNGILTPACGLGLRTKAEAEAVLRALGEFRRVALDRL